MQKGTILMQLTKQDGSFFTAKPGQTIASAFELVAEKNEPAEILQCLGYSCGFFVVIENKYDRNALIARLCRGFSGSKN